MHVTKRTPRFSSTSPRGASSRRRPSFRADASMACARSAAQLLTLARRKIAPESSAVEPEIDNVPAGSSINCARTGSIAGRAPEPLWSRCAGTPASVGLGAALAGSRCSPDALERRTTGVAPGWRPELCDGSERFFELNSARARVGSSFDAQPTARVPAATTSAIGAMLKQTRTTLRTQLRCATHPTDSEERASSTGSWDVSMEVSVPCLGAHDAERSRRNRVRARVPQCIGQSDARTGARSHGGDPKRGERRHQCQHEDKRGPRDAIADIHRDRCAVLRRDLRNQRPIGSRR